MNLNLKSLIKVVAVMSFALISACSDNSASNTETKMEEIKAVAGDIIGNNAFFYYKDYDGAVDFYSQTMGFKNVFEFPDFAMIFQTSPTTFLTIVNDNGRGMHSSDEPKTIAVAFLTDEPHRWYDYMVSQGAEIKNGPKPIEDTPHNGFIMLDPGGYSLEFEYFAPHAENTKFMPLLDASENIYPLSGQETTRPTDLGFKASIYWLYHKDAKEAVDFYTNVMGLEMIVQQPFSDIYTSSRTGYIGLVLSGEGMHTATHEKAVNVGFLTSNAQTWFDYLKDQPTFKLRTEELYHEADGDGNELIDIVIGYDPDNYFIEIDQFLDVDANKAIREAVGQ